MMALDNCKVLVTLAKTAWLLSRRGLQFCFSTNAPNNGATLGGARRPAGLFRFLILVPGIAQLRQLAGLDFVETQIG